MVVLAALLVACSSVAAPDARTASSVGASSTPAVSRTPTRSTARSTDAAVTAPPSSAQSSPTKSSPRPTTSSTVAAATFHVSDPVELPTQVGTEASGLARSQTIPGAFWTVGDATGTDTVTAVDLSGTLRAEVTVTDMAADNAEAIVSGPCGDARCLYVGDIGDNAALRDHVAVYRLPEPKSGQTRLNSEEW